MIKHLENNNFKEEIKNGLWIVDFYADWCGPCKMLGPVLETIEENILKVNVDQHEDLAREFSVMSIPTICFFKNGKLEQKVIGFRNKDEIEEIIEAVR